MEAGDWGLAGGKTWTYPAYDFSGFTDIWWGPASDFNPPFDETDPLLAFDGDRGETSYLGWSQSHSDPDAGRIVFLGATQLASDDDYAYCTRVTLTVAEADGTTPIELLAPPRYPWAHFTSGRTFKVKALFEAAENPGAVADGAHDFAPCTTLTSGWAPARTFYDALPAKSGSDTFESSYENGFSWSGRPPAPTTGAVSGISQTGATLNGTVDDHGWGGLSYTVFGGACCGTTATWFEYGRTTAYGTVAGGAVFNASDTDPRPSSATISGLEPGTTYHYRFVASNHWTINALTREEYVPSGAIRGPDRTFTTAAAPGTGRPGPGPPGGGTPPPGSRDTLAPTANVVITTRSLRKVLRGGLRGRMVASEDGRWTAALTVSRKALGRSPKSRRVVVGKASGQLKLNGNDFRVKIGKKHARKLRRLKKVTLRLQLKLVDGAGNGQTKVISVKLRR